MALAFSIAIPITRPGTSLTKEFSLSKLPTNNPINRSTSKALKAVLERAFVPTPGTTTTVYSPTRPPAKTTPSSPLPPGLSDAQRFSLGPSVPFWSSYDHSTFHKRLPKALLNAVRNLTNFPRDTLYWFYCSLRILFHTTLGALALITSALAGTVPLRSAVKVLFLETFGLFEEAAHVLYQDRDYVRKRVFNHPWDISLFHRQHNPFFMLANVARFLVEGASIVRKRKLQNPDTATWLEGDMYPPYYKHTFHYQTDGWVSSASADVYEITTETLFVGRQDAMQRLTLTALSDFLGRPGSPCKIDGTPRVVEIAAGTGRVATYVRDNWPGIDYVVSDLSPFYLEKARGNMRYWERTAGRKKKDSGRVRYLQAMAENLPMADSSVDVVFAVYLFHELPESQRRAVITEAARVLRPGGLFVITDSIQVGDRPSRDETLNSFTKLNEPYYTSYISDDLGAAAVNTNKFIPLQKELSSVSKMLSFLRKRSEV